MKAKITISRPSFGDGKEAICIRVTDSNSRVRILEVEVGYAEFAQIITGLGEVECDISSLVSEADHAKLGKTKEVLSVYCERDWDKYVQKELVLKDFADKYLPDGWEIWDDGLSSQQHYNQHKYIIARWDN